MTHPSRPLAILSAAALLASCGPSDLASTPVDSRTNLANTGAYSTDTGIKPPTLEKIDTGIDPKAAR